LNGKIEKRTSSVNSDNQTRPMNRKQRRAAKKDCKIGALDVTALFTTAVHHYQARRWKETEHALRGVLAVQENHTEAVFLRGLVAEETGRPEEAATWFLKAIALQPKHADAHNGLGMAYRQQGRLEDAVGCFRRALEIDPNFAEAQTNCGNALRDLGRAEEALAYCRLAVALVPGGAEIRCNLGTVLHDLGRMDEAIGTFREAVALQPDLAHAHFSLGMALLAGGDMARGWTEYEWRWKTEAMRGARRDFTRPEWRGEAAIGQTLLIQAEQGFGDTIQFCRYASLAAARGLRVILEVQQPLVRLLRSLKGVEQVVAAGEALPSFDLQISMLSQPRVFGTTVETIPQECPYLHAEDRLVASWRERLGDDPRLRVGLVWAGNPRREDPTLTAIDRRRSMAPEQLAPLFDIPEIKFFSLQKYGAAMPSTYPLNDMMGEMNDFADTAGLIANLDLVIAVDTAVAHLASALGKPVWMLDRFDACWRWLVGRDDTPWYPTLKIFRQKKAGDWDAPISEIAHQLRQIIAGRLSKP
jgi:tetratricopeptide (TPR) repeat protein